jgi:hypothetical protein
MVGFFILGASLRLRRAIGAPQAKGPGYPLQFLDPRPKLDLSSYLSKADPHRKD